MFDRVGSTSWSGRHTRAFSRLADLLAADGSAGAPRVLVVGPGAVTRLMRPLLRDASVDRPGRLRGRLRDLARYADQFLRRVVVLPLVSPEMIELRAALPSARWIVVDRSRRVLRAVKRDVPAADCIRADLSTTPLPQQADVVVAFNVVPRTRSPQRATQHVLAAVRPGGLLLVDDRTAETGLPGPPSFTPLGDKVYRRGP